MTKRHKYLKVEGAEIHIQTGLTAMHRETITSIEIIPDDRWQLRGCRNTRLMKEEV